MSKLQTIYKQVVAEDNSPSKEENQAMAIRRFAEELGLKDERKLNEFFNEVYDLLSK